MASTAWAVTGPRHLNPHCRLVQSASLEGPPPLPHGNPWHPLYVHPPLSACITFHHRPSLLPPPKHPQCVHCGAVIAPTKRAPDSLDSPATTTMASSSEAVECPIPIVDFDGFREGDAAHKAKIAAAIGAAARDIGFMAVNNHGVDPAVIETMGKETWAFFDLPAEEKEKWASPSEAEYPYGATHGQQHASSLQHHTPPPRPTPRALPRLRGVRQRNPSFWTGGGGCQRQDVRLGGVGAGRRSRAFRSWRA